MNVSKYLEGDLLKLKVVPQSGREELVEENGFLKLYLRSAPEKGKANLELIQFFKKRFNLQVRVKAGFTGRKKVLEVRQRERKIGDDVL